MKSPFTKKPDPALQKFFASATYADKLRVAAARETGGELELRHRHHKDGTVTISMWLCVKGSDSAMRLIPAPDEVRGGDGNG